MSTPTQYLTQEKFDTLKKELDYLKTDRRKEVAENLEYAKKLGDLSENAEYHDARERQAEVEDRIRHLEQVLKDASILEQKGGGLVIVAGSTVRLARKDDKTKSYLYTIVGSEEADMSIGKISNLSPIGSALLGHKEGDSISVKTPKGMISYTIEKIK